MVEYTSVRVSETIKDRLDEEQRPGETRNDQLDRLLSQDATPEGGDMGQHVTIDGEELLKRLESIESTIERIPEETANTFGDKFV